MPDVAWIAGWSRRRVHQQRHGELVSIDSKSLYHEAKAAGMIYQATLRHHLHTERGFEWQPVEEHSGMAEIAGVTTDDITVWSRRSTRLREWAKQNLVVVDGEPTAAQLAAAQKATRPAKPESLSFEDLKAEWRADPRGLHLDRAAHQEARALRTAAARTREKTAHQDGRTARQSARTAHQDVHTAHGDARTAHEDAQDRASEGAPLPVDRASLVQAAARIDKAGFTRADMIELIGAHPPVDIPGDPARVIDWAVDQVGIRINSRYP